MIVFPTNKISVHWDKNKIKNTQLDFFPKKCFVSHFNGHQNDATKAEKLENRFNLFFTFLRPTIKLNKYHLSHGIDKAIIPRNVAKLVMRYNLAGFDSAAIRPTL